MKKVLKVFSLTVIFLFFLSMFAWVVFHVSIGDKKFAFLQGPIKFMYSFPDLFFQSVEEVNTLPGTFVKTPEDFEAVNKLDSDFIVLTSYSDSKDSRLIVAINLKNDSVLYKWNVKNPYEETDRIINPIMFSDKSLVFSFQGKSLMKIDSLSNIVWKQDSIDAHHSMNLDSNGDVWVCSFAPVFHATGFYMLNDRKIFYKDNHITKIDVEAGRILFHKSVTDILVENNLSNYILKSANIEDPIHINDVEPALKTTKYFNEGDLFISARQASIIIHYRPSTNKVIDIIEGPFIAQHDVDILNDSTLVIFNNNSYVVKISNGRETADESFKFAIAGDFYSNIIRYDFASGEFSFIGDSVFRANKIYTHTEGLMEFINPSTYFVEEQNTGEIWIIRDDEVLYKNVFNSQYDGYHHLPNWTRIINYVK